MKKERKEEEAGEENHINPSRYMLDKSKGECYKLIIMAPPLLML